MVRGDFGEICLVNSGFIGHYKLPKKIFRSLLYWDLYLHIQEGGGYKNGFPRRLRSWGRSNQGKRLWPEDLRGRSSLAIGPKFFSETINFTRKIFESTGPKPQGPWLHRRPGEPEERVGHVF